MGDVSEIPCRHRLFRICEAAGLPIPYGDDDTIEYSIKRHVTKMKRDLYVLIAEKFEWDDINRENKRI